MDYYLVLLLVHVSASRTASLGNAVLGHNHNLRISRTPLKSQAHQGTSLFMSAKRRIKGVVLEYVACLYEFYKSCAIMNVVKIANEHTDATPCTSD